MLVADAVNQFIAARGGRKSLRTMELYRERLASFVAGYGQMTVAEIGGDDVANWLSMLERRGYALATMAGYRQSIKALFRWCVERGLIDRSPAAGLTIGSFVSRRRKIPALADVDRATEVARRWCQTDDVQQVRDGLIILLSRACGPRSREIRQLRLSEVRNSLTHTPPDGVYVLRTHGKTGETLLRFGENVAAACRRWLEIRPKTSLDVCFITLRQVGAPGDSERRYRPLARRSLDGAYERVCHEAGVPLIRSHAFRHYVGHMLVKNHTARVAGAILNHADDGVLALRFYHHPDSADVNRAVLDIGADPINELFKPRH